MAYQGFLANELFGEKIATAREGHFYNGYTSMNFHSLDDKTEGADNLLDANLKAIVKHKQDLKNGKRVNVHLKWELTEDRREYQNVEVLSVEVVEGER